MKRIIFIFFFIQISVVLFSQTISINCPSGNCNTPVEPLTSLNYTVTYTLGQNDTFVDIVWSCIGGSSGCNGSGTSTFIAWANTPNTNNAHNLQASVRYRNNGLKTKSSAIVNVTVKYIQAITQLNLNTINGNVFITNGSSNQLSCGSQPLILTIPTPATDPASAITYTWQFPWGTQTTSTPSVSTTSDVGQTDATIIVSAKRTDGNLVQYFGFTLTRPRVETPTITGIPSTNMCYNSAISISGSSNNAITYNWTITGAISTGWAIFNSVVILSGSTGSSGTVTLTTDNTCQSPKSVTRTIFVGGPVITNATVNGQPLSIPNYIYNPALLNITANNLVGTNYSWTVTQGNGSIYYNTPNSNAVSAYAYPFVQIQAATSNQCGSGETRTFYLYDISNGYYRMASPNPATSTVSADVMVIDALKKMTLVSDARPGIVRMYNANGSLNADTHRHNNLISFDVNNLPRGRYYLNFFFEGNKTFTELIDLN